MKKFSAYVWAFCLILFSSYAMAGDTLRGLGASGLPGHSSAFGMSLDDWMGAYIRWLEAGADPNDRIKNTVFLPIMGNEPGVPYEVEVKTGTPLVLPVYLYLGFPEDEPITEDEWAGWGYVQVDGQEILFGGADNYVGPTYLDPYAILFGVYEIAFYQAIGVLIEPLAAGEHVITLQSGYGTGEPFENQWNVKVLPGGKKK